MNTNIKNKVVILVFLVLLVLLLSACDKEAIIGDRTYTFSGFVTDSISGFAIDSAAILIDDTTTTPRFYSDSSGYYTGAVFRSAQTRTFYVQKTGYYTQSRNIVLDRNLTNINFVLVQDTTK